MSKIEWTNKTWNPVIGCRHVSEGCRNCYAETMSKRLVAMGQKDYAGVLDEAGRFNGKVIARPGKLDVPLRRRIPTRYFVNSMSDLFHEDVPFEFTAAVFGVMAASPDHTFQILTKRPARMLEFMRWMDAGDNAHSPQAQRMFDSFGEVWADLPRINTRDDEGDQCWKAVAKGWPLPNVWLGVSIENQETADERVPLLLETPAAVHFLSYEPALGPVDLMMFAPFLAHLGPVGIECEHGYDACPICDKGIDWVIIGGESGPNARPCNFAWMRGALKQCRSCFVPAFVKQVGANAFTTDDHLDFNSAAAKKRGSSAHTWRDGKLERITHGGTAETFEAAYDWPTNDPKGGDPEDWPEDLRVRQYPRASNG